MFFAIGCVGLVLYQNYRVRFLNGLYNCLHSETMKYKCLIVENDPLERDLLEMLLRKIESAEIVAVCENGMSAMQVLLREEVDLVFTDIDMPELSGIDLLKSLKNPPAFVFISAHGKFAVEGFDLDVADFILKPVTAYRLLKAFGKAKVLHDKKEVQGAVTTPLAAEEEGVFFARTSDGLQKLLLQSILFAESKANFSVLHMEDGSRHMILVGLKQLQEQLPAVDFMRIHKLFIINWRHVSLINKDSLTIAGKHEVFIGPSYRPALNDKIAGYQLLERRKDK